MPEPGFLLYKNSRLCYYRFGKGDKVVLCFHGYGEDGNSFSFLENFAGNDFTFLAFDLPFHGKTQWDDGNMTAEDLVNIIKELLSKNFKHETSNFKLLGFSLGGRMALSVYEAMPSKIDRVILLAPDGLKVNFWYWLSTQTILGNKLFSFTMSHPGWFFSFLKFINFFRLVNKSIFKFVNFYIGNVEVRKLLYLRWTSLRKLKPDPGRVKNSIRQHNTPVRLLYGKHDRIILPNAGRRFCTGIENNCRISMIHSGHQVLHENHIAEILPALND
jgi:pimeloyl-ACP methyl ester carboxylesterase